MLKNKLLLILILSFFLISTKSLAVAHPEYINWRGSPRDFVISLYEGMYESVTENNTLIDNMASIITSDPKSRLDLFWRFINSTEYQNSMWAKQLKEYNVYGEYVLSSMYRYYVAKQPTEKDVFVQGTYAFGVAMALRDFSATFVPKSIEYEEMWNFVPRNLRHLPHPGQNNSYQIDPYNSHQIDTWSYDLKLFIKYLDKKEEILKSPAFNPIPAPPYPYKHHCDCNDKQESGANNVETFSIDMGQTSGSFLFDYNTKTKKDQIIITHDGNLIFDSGCVDERKSIRLKFNGYSTSIIVRVNPNCDGGVRTKWNFIVHCPEN